MKKKKSSFGRKTKPEAFTPDVLAYSAERTVDEECLRAADITCDADETISIPYHNLDWSILRDNGEPYVRRKLLNGFDAKFLQPPKTQNHLYLGPLMGPLKGRTWTDIAADPTVKVLFTEGEYKVLALARLGYAVIGIGGIANYKTKANPNKKDSKKIWLPDFNLITWKGRKVVLIPDHDVIVRQELRKEMAAVALKLEGQGSDIGIVELPALLRNGKPDLKTGADDFLAQEFGPEMMQELIKEAHPLSDDRYSDFTPQPRESYKPTGIPKEWANRAPPIEYLIEGFMPRDAVFVAAAVTDVGKTFVYYQAAVCVAAGHPFNERYTKCGRVLFLTAEDRVDDMWRRYEAIVKGYTEGMTTKDADEFKKKVSANLTVKPVVGRQRHLIEMRDGMVVQTDEVLHLINDCRDCGYVWIIFDPLARFHALPEDDRTFTQLIVATERISIALACAILLTHHKGKNQNLQGIHSPRGSSALPAAARGMHDIIAITDPEKLTPLGVTDSDDVQNGVVEIWLPKIKDRKRPPMFMQRTNSGFLRYFRPANQPDTDDTLLQALRQYFKKHSKLKGLSETQIIDSGKLKSGKPRGHRPDIFGENVTMKRAKTWLQGAIANGTVLKAPKGTIKNSDAYIPIPETSKDAPSG